MQACDCLSIASCYNTPTLRTLPGYGDQLSVCAGTAEHNVAISSKLSALASQGKAGEARMLVTRSKLSILHPIHRDLGT